MTDLDDFLDNATIDRPTPASADFPKRPGLWRSVSLLAVAAAMAIGALSVLQARDASNVAVPDREPIALENTTVTITDLPITANAEVAVLGLPDSESRRGIGADGVDIGLPEEMAALIALTDSSGAVVGLALVPEGEDRNRVRLSARSTAQALMVLSPGILRPNLAESFANLGVVESDPAFENLVDAVRSNSNLSTNNEAVEQAYAEIADRLPAQRPEADQGCDSVIARDAYPSAGTCVQPEDTGILIANEQDRWALVFSGTPGFAELCATVSPTGTVGAEVLIPSEQCVGNSLLVAPGPVTNQGEDQQVIEDRVRVATAVNVLYEYAGPFADLAGGSAGFTGEAVTYIRQNFQEVVQSLTLLVDSNEEFSAAMDVNRSAATALDRQVAAINAARIIIEAADTTALIPQRSPFDTRHLDILDFFVRAGERMAGTRTDWRWEADAVGMVDFGDGS